MKGFEERWVDLPDFILGITKEIWEDRGLGPKIRQYYGKNVIVRTPGGISIGDDATVASTVATLQEFPDRQLFGEDVIWSGSPETGMLSSHRILSMATHVGSGFFGIATGKPVSYRVIADCYAKDNMITDEWLVRDNGAILRQIGHDPRAWAAVKVAEGTQAFTPDQNIKGPYSGKGNKNEWGLKLGNILSVLMKGEFSVVSAEYDRACHLEYTGGITRHGHAEADKFWMGLRASFPNAEFSIEHQIGIFEPFMSPRAAIRWTLNGKHEGWGAFGAPTNAPISIMGITHAEFGPYGLRREYTLYDEAAVWMQISAHLG